MLVSLGQEEVDSIIAEQGSVTVTCEFCGRKYSFDPVDAAHLFACGIESGIDWASCEDGTDRTANLTS